MKTETRFARFEPITVATAARVLQLQRAGVVTPQEADFYLRELLALDAHADETAFPGLFRAAQLRASTRPVGGQVRHSRRRPAHSPACLEPAA